MSNENKSFFKFLVSLIIMLGIFFYILKSQNALFTAFKIIMILILIGIIVVFIFLVIMIRKIKKYFDFQQQAEYDFNKFFNEFYQAEYDFERYQKFRQAQNEYRQEKQTYRNHSERKNYTEYQNSNDIKRAMILFGYKDLESIKEDELKKKYRALVKQAHPDNGGSVDKMQTINTYYNVLLKTIEK